MFDSLVYDEHAELFETRLTGRAEDTRLALITLGRCAPGRLFYTPYLYEFLFESL